MGLLHIMTTRVLTALLLLAVLLLLEPVSASRRRQPSRACPAIPRFRVNDEEPMALARGNVTLVALLTSTCSFCIGQSRALQELYENLESNDAGVHMMIINGGPRPVPGETGVFEGIVSFPVYHDDDNRTIWRQVFQGSKDDIFVADRCGQRAYRIPFPYSYLGYNYVRTALNRVLAGNVCTNCPPPDLEDMMMGDAPALGGYGSRALSHRLNYGRYPQGHSGISQRGGSRSNSHRNLNRSRCPWYDRLCRDLRKARRRYNQFRRQHGIRRHPGMREEEILGLFQRSQRGSMGPVL